MTGITFVDNGVIYFRGRNVIQNNSNTEGAGIILQNTAEIIIQGELLLYNNTADKHGGAILVKQPLFYSQDQFMQSPLMYTKFFDNSSSVTFSGNRAGKGGSDMYGAILMGCNACIEIYIQI